MGIIPGKLAISGVFGQLFYSLSKGNSSTFNFQFVFLSSTPVHTSFAKSLNDKKASILDSSAFALTHISHFGLVFINNQCEFLSVPTFIWVISMFVVSILFLFSKNMWVLF